MHVTSIFVLLLSALWSSPVHHVGLQDTASLCAIQENPESYAGRTVTVSAILGSTGEFRAFRDESCPARMNPHSGKHDLIEATFNQEQYDTTSKQHTKLMALLKKRREAQVTCCRAVCRSRRLCWTSGLLPLPA